MSKTKRPKFWLSLMLRSLSCLSSCAADNYDICPTYPVAGPKVAAEISRLNNAPAFWEWLARINKLRLQLEICKN